MRFQNDESKVKMRNDIKTACNGIKKVVVIEEQTYYK